MSGRLKFQKYKAAINLLVIIFSYFPYGMNRYFFVFVRNLNGNVGLLLRYIFLKILSKECGENVSIHANTFIFNIEKISFGNNVSIHPMCYIDGAGEINIGNDVSIAHNTSILSTNHTWLNIDLPIKYNKEIMGSVIIHDDVWIGCGCRILAGVTISSRTVLAAGAVINRDVKPNSVVGGIPAREIKKI